MSCLPRCTNLLVLGVKERASLFCGWAHNLSTLRGILILKVLGSKCSHLLCVLSYSPRSEESGKLGGAKRPFFCSETLTATRKWLAGE
eukprot:106103-Amphidinium_carterae.1